MPEKAPGPYERLLVRENELEREIERLKAKCDELRAERDELMDRLAAAEEKG